MASSLRGAKRRSNPEKRLDCFATLAMTGLDPRPAPGEPQTEPRQCGTQAFGRSRLGIMVGTGFFDGLWLGALGEVRVGETRSETVSLFLRGGRALGKALSLGCEVDDAFKRKSERRLIDHDLRGAGPGE